MVDAQTIDTKLSDADATAARSFLQGRIEPAGLRYQYMDDLAVASTTLAAAAAAAGTDPAVTASAKKIAVDLPVYTGLVETAQFNQRQSFYPLAAGYLGEANNLMRGKILPAATQLYGLEEQKLTTDEDHATNGWGIVAGALLFVVLLLSLILVQVWLKGHFRRTLNVPLAIGTAIVLVLGLAFGVALTAQSSGVDSASSNGSKPLVIYTQAQIRALAMMADDELTLLTRDSVPSYQADYHGSALKLRRLVDSATSGAGSSGSTQLGQARGALVLVHAAIRGYDPTNLNAAVTLASYTNSDDLPQVSRRLVTALHSAAVSRNRVFQQEATGATGDLVVVIWAAVILSILAAILIIVGVASRLAEYR
jgi:hypothetical protein